MDVYFCFDQHMHANDYADPNDHFELREEGIILKSLPNLVHV
jgi:hypothetical protein